MTRILLVRHGEVAGNTGELPAFVGWSDLPLNVRGQAQAQAVADYLQHEKIAAVYSSDLQRAQLTGCRIAEKQELDVHADPDLREVNYGKWEGLSEAELLREYSGQWQARQKDPWNIAAIEGENYAQMWARFLPKWNAIVEKHENETVVLVGHNGLLRILLCYLLGAPFENFKRIRVANCSVTRVEIDRNAGGGERVLVQSVNDTCHLKNIELQNIQ